VLGVESTHSKVKDYSPYVRVSISHQQSWLWTDLVVNQAWRAAGKL